MSGTGPYAYYDLGTEIPALYAVGEGEDILLYAYDATTMYIVDAGNTEFFQQGCVTARYAGEPPNNHPEGSYNISYPYCRTMLRFDMTDKRGNPQIAQLIALAPFVSIRLIIEGCDVSDILSVTSKVEPQQSVGCGAELYPGYAPNELFFLITASLLTLPARITFTVTNVNGLVKTFWIGLRDSRDGVPSGAVV